MYRFNFMVEDDQMTRLREVSERSHRSVADHLRWMIDALAPLHSQFLSGAVVLGIQARTTSGEVWIGGGGLG